PDGQATFNSITNNGTLTLESDENGTASLIVDNYTGNDAEIELYASTNYWHYVSSPVQSLDATAFGTPNLAAYYESRISNSQDVGWIAYDGYRYTDGTTSDTTFSTLSVGIGYDYYNTVTNTLSLSGSLNTSGPSISLAYNSKGTDPDYPGSQGFNLLGNPFTSCLDWDQITLDPSITGAIYFTYNGSYASYVNGVGTNGGAGTIPPMQGFFVKTLAQGTSVTLSEDARVHNISQISYKGDSEVIPLIRLKLENNLKSDEAVVRFDEKATAEFDNLLDALKFSQTGNGTGIWTKTGNINFSINGLPFPDNKVEIPVGIYTAESGNTTITGSQIEGLENYNIVLTDKLTGTSIILKESGSYAFQSQTGIVSDRFILAISNISTPVPEITLPEDMFKIYSSRGILYIQSLSETWDSQPGTVSIYDLFGRRIVQKDNVSWSNGEIKELSLNAANGIYIVEIKSKSLKFIGKFNFNK
ncbi:MAG: T9SS type A sorting domain-containing protein, partial [Bacteroidales bacterium]|nr:T9SS type A sorting domain-containing protein [Bacteroidales bacterium]